MPFIKKVYGDVDGDDEMVKIGLYLSCVAPLSLFIFVKSTAKAKGLSGHRSTA